MKPRGELPPSDTRSQEAVGHSGFSDSADTAEIKALKARLAYEDSLLEMIHEAAVVFDDAERITFWNRAAERMYGWKAEEVLDRTCQQVLGDRVPVEVRATAAGRMDPEDFTSLCGRFSPRRKNGHALDVEVDVRPYRDAERCIAGWVSVHHDITERSRSERAVHESEARLLALVEASPLGIVMMDIDGNPIYYNPECEAIHDRTLEEARGRGWAECVHPEDRERVVASWYTAASEQRLWSDTYRFVHRNGRVVWVSGRAAPMRIEGKTVGFVGTLEDVTALKIAEQTERQLKDLACEARARAEHATHVRDRMMGVVAHDLRNPVNAIALGVAALRNESLVDEQRIRQLGIIQRTVVTMDRLIRDLLDVTRMESGRFAVECVPTRIADLLRETLELFESTARQRAISLRCDLLPDSPVVAGDHHRLLQVLSNVIGNALKFTPFGGAITISMQPAERHLQLSVQDTGPGVSKEDLPLLFDRFWQATGASQTGAGLGLHIAKGIVEAHGGQIWAESAPGCGLRVCWTIPFAASFS